MESSFYACMCCDEIGAPGYIRLNYDHGHLIHISRYPGEIYYMQLSAHIL
jgi:hypothetical protein